MKSPACLIIMIIAVGLLFFGDTVVFACGGDGNQSQAEPQRTGIKSNGLPNAASSGITFDRDREYVSMNQYPTRRINENRAWLKFFYTFETFLDIGTFTANTGVLGYTIYCWKVGKTAIVFPVSMVWQVFKLGPRAIYGGTTGNMNTVKKLNEKTWTGRRANELISVITGEAQIPMMILREERIKSQREEQEKSFISNIPAGLK